MIPQRRRLGDGNQSLQIIEQEHLQRADSLAMKFTRLREVQT